MALLLILLMMMVVVQPPGLQPASASDLGSEYEWSPTLIKTKTPKDNKLAKQATTGVQPLHIIYGLPSREFSGLDTQNVYHDDSEQQHQLPLQQIQQQQLHQQEHSNESPQEDYPGAYTNFDTNINTDNSKNEIKTEFGKPSTRPLIKQQISDKTWNVAAPYIKPADNLIEDVSFNIGIILVAFTVFVLSLGAIAGALTTKRTGGRALLVNDLARDVLAGIRMLEMQFND